MSPVLATAISYIRWVVQIDTPAARRSDNR
jgi:hypothetical protein